jgi:hypothetical protein
MNADRKPEHRRQARGDIIPAPPPIRRSPDPVMVLLIENIPSPRRAHDVVHTGPRLSVTRRSGVIVMPAGLGIGKPVAALPCIAPVFRRENARGRNPYPHFPGVIRIRQDRMQNQSRSAGIPASGRGMIGQPLDPAPGYSAIRALEQLRRLGSGINGIPCDAHRPDLRKFLAERRLFPVPANVRREIGISRRPIIHHPACELGQFPGFTAIFGSPNTRA